MTVGWGGGGVDGAAGAGACMSVVATMATRITVLVGRCEVLGSGVVCGLLDVRG